MLSEMENFEAYNCNASDGKEVSAIEGQTKYVPDAYEIK